MKISLENAVKATSEYLNKEFSAMGEDKDKRQSFTFLKISCME